MEISKKFENNTLIISVSGRIDTLTSPILENEINNVEGEFLDIIFDFDEVEYISSACLRVLLTVKKKMPQNGEISIIKANQVVREVFQITGFDKFIQVHSK